MKINKYDLILGFLILFEIFLCLYIANTGSHSYLCVTGSGCSSVQNSIYGMLFGIKLAWFGVISFSILFLLFLLARFKNCLYWPFFICSIIGALFSIYFMSLQAFVLREFCKECMTIDVIMILMFIIVVFEFIDFRKEVKSLEKEVKNAVGKAL